MNHLNNTMKKIILLAAIIGINYTAEAQKKDEKGGTKIVKVTRNPKLDEADKKIASENYQGALEILKVLLNEDPNNLEAWDKRGFCHKLTEDYNAAIDDYNHFLSIKSSDKHALLSRGSAYQKLKKYNEAIRDFDAALAVDPEFQEALNNRGWAKKGMGDTDGACKDWNKSKKLGNEEAKIILKNNRCR